MRKIITIFCCVALSASLQAQTNKTTVKTVKTKSESPKKVEIVNVESVNVQATPIDALTFHENEYDFGKIPQGKPVTHVFEFKNSGTTPFKLENVQASCGCTTPEWKQDEVAPGATSKIIVGFNAAGAGPFAKPVTITYNGGQSKQIIIKGEVESTPPTPAPENAAIKSMNKSN
ncbi:MAG: DUF1573 domain-containing protein [Ginsengibacter sp.]